jgi:hypothetical protein
MVYRDRHYLVRDGGRVDDIASDQPLVDVASQTLTVA